MDMCIPFVLSAIRIEIFSVLVVNAIFHVSLSYNEAAFWGSVLLN